MSLLHSRISVGNLCIGLGMSVMFASLCFSIVLAHISMAFVMAGWIFSRPAVWKLPGFIFCAAFAAWIFLGAAWLSFSEGQEFLHSRYGTGFIWIAMYLGAVGFSDQFYRRWAILAALATMCASVAVAAAQFFVGHGSKPPFRIDSSGDRFFSSRGFLPKHLMQGFMMTILFIVFLGNGTAFGVSQRWVWIGRGLALTGVVLANSRSGLVALLSGVGVFSLTNRAFKIRLITGVAAVFFISISWMWFFSPQKLDKVLRLEDERFFIWNIAAEMIIRRPWFGVGGGGGYSAENTKIVKSLYPEEHAPHRLKVAHAHNIYLGLAAEHGVPALLLYFAAVIGVLRHLYLRRNVNPAGWQMGSAVTAAMMAGGMTEHYAGLSLPTYGYFCVLGLAMALDEQYLRERGVIPGVEGA